MFAGWKGWIVFGLGVVGDSFVLRPLLPASPSRTMSKTRASTSKMVMQEASSTAATSSAPQSLSAAAVEIDEISGKRLYVEFAAFGFFNRTCQLELRENGDCVFSKGMVTRQDGAWRIEEEEGTEYLQFSSPLTEIYSEIFLIPSSLLFWRVPLRKAEDGAIVLQGGQIISERKELIRASVMPGSGTERLTSPDLPKEKWVAASQRFQIPKIKAYRFGLRTSFIDEGKFKARVLDDDEEFPEREIDISMVKVPEGLTTRKKKKAIPNLVEEVAEPPLPSDLAT